MKYPVDPNRPICVNIGCDSHVHLSSRSSTGRPVYRPVCGACHKSKLDLLSWVIKSSLQSIETKLKPSSSSAFSTFSPVLRLISLSSE